MCSLKDFFLAHLPGFLLVIAVSSSVYLGASLLTLISIPNVLQLFLIAVVAIISLPASLLLFPASWVRHLYPWVIDHFSEGFPFGSTVS
jgi:hypothetical protein